jgi:hypothetical protein
MPQDDYERYRRRLEEQLHADIGMLYEAFQAKLRAYQTIHRSRGGELDLDPQLAAGYPPHLSPIPAPAPPAPAALEAPPPRSSPESVLYAIREILPSLPEDFDRTDVLQALGFEPRRSTFYQALNQLRVEGLIDVTRDSGGKRPAQYQKVAAAS